VEVMAERRDSHYRESSVHNCLDSEADLKFLPVLASIPLMTVPTTPSVECVVVCATVYFLLLHKIKKGG
jgi:hypothetical protein